MMSASKGPASVSTRFAAGSIERMVVWTNRSPGLSRSRYGWNTAEGRRPPEHDVELREPEHEPLALVDQDDVEFITELVGQPRRQLQAAEARTQHEDPHRAMLRDRFHNRF